LDRMSLVDIYKCYFDSHFHNALVLLACAILYGIIEPEPLDAYFLRMWSILLVVFSWITAPIIFNAYATADALHTDLKVWGAESDIYGACGESERASVSVGKYHYYIEIIYLIIQLFKFVILCNLFNFFS